MPDISKCVGDGCPIKETCYRFVCKADPHWQSYCSFQYDKTLKKCDDFYPLRKPVTENTVTKKKRK